MKTDFKHRAVVVRGLIVVGVLIVIGLYLQTTNGHLPEVFASSNFSVRNLRNHHLPTFYYSFDNYLQFVPLLVLLGLRAAGRKAAFPDKWLVVYMACAYLLVVGTISVLKLSTGILRPDTSDFFSFPSGHTASAFTSATLLYFMYRHRGRWVGIVAYTAAFITGFMRILNNRHWLLDVIVGALLAFLITDGLYHALRRRIGNRPPQAMR